MDSLTPRRPAPSLDAAAAAFPRASVPPCPAHTVDSALPERGQGSWEAGAVSYTQDLKDLLVGGWGVNLLSGFQ